MLTNFGTFTNILAGMDADYHVAAIVGDPGCVNPGGELFIDNSHSASQAVVALLSKAQKTLNAAQSA